MVERGRLPREVLLRRLAELIGGLRCPHTLRVALDGPDASGKTTLADDLAARLVGVRPVIRAGVDGFHRPAGERHRRGNLSPEGYFHDSFDEAALRDQLLRPLGPAGNGRYRRAVFDARADTPVRRPLEQAPPRSVLLFDGVFLLRDELRPYWELSLFLEVDAAETLRRALARDVGLFGDEATVRERYLHRYLPGQRLYRAQARPAEIADIVVDNDDPDHPRILAWSVAGAGAGDGDGDGRLTAISSRWRSE
jgi:uridine kinase